MSSRRDLKEMGKRKLKESLQWGLEALQYGQVSKTLTETSQREIEIMSKIDVDEVIQACEDNDGTGFCIACGESQGECEPDARGYECESCGEMKVYGAEEIVLMGLC